MSRQKITKLMENAIVFEDENITQVTHHNEDCVCHHGNDYDD